MTRISKCVHVSDPELAQLKPEDIQLKFKDCCSKCSYDGNSRWVCLCNSCLSVLCGERANNHSAGHFEVAGHPLQLNVKTLRIWCNACVCEVYPDNIPPWSSSDMKTFFSKSGCSLKKVVEPSSLNGVHKGMQNGFAIKDTADSSEDREQAVESSRSRSVNVPGSDETNKNSLSGRMFRDRKDYWNASPEAMDDNDDEQGPKGLTGLGNIGNTCYANAALQALLNCVPLSNYFLSDECVHLSDKRHGIAAHFAKLVKEIWSPKRKSYIVPSTLLAAVRLAYPMFRGFNQQDSQEFLRCLVDFLHEELKQPVYRWELEQDELRLIANRGHLSEIPDFYNGSTAQESLGSSSPSPHASDYETADSGLSSDKEDEYGRVARMKSNKTHSLKKYPEIQQRTEEYKLSSSSEEESASTNDRRLSFRHSESSNRHHSSKSLRSRNQSSCSVACSEIGDERKPIKSRSIISDTFDGKILSSVQCLTCRTVSRTVETFQDLSLPLPSWEQLLLLRKPQYNANISSGAGTSSNSNPSSLGWVQWIYSFFPGWLSSQVLTLEDCLAAFFAADELKGDDMYSCDKCKKLRNGAKICQVLELPEVLCIHLKRFKHEFMYSSKISSRVSFPLSPLEMKPFLHSDCRSKITSYELFAVICHHGSAGGGHYTSYCLNNEDHNWYEMDDSCVTRVDLSVVENAEAYVLLYRKSQDKAIELRQRAEAILQHVAAKYEQTSESDIMRFYVNRSWVNRFNTFAEPGPLSNYDFLCRHGGIIPSKAQYIEELFVSLPSALWQFLNDNFGSIGYTCSNLVHCAVCQREFHRLERRRITEKDTYLKLKEESKRSCNVQRVYALSLRWFKEWEQFILGNEYFPPGSIDNTSVLMKKHDQIYLRPGSSYLSLVQDQWQFFYQRYGGGPEVLYSLNNPQNVTVNLKPLHVNSDQDLEGEPVPPPPESASGFAMPISAPATTKTSVPSDSANIGACDCGSHGDNDNCSQNNVEMDENVSDCHAASSSPTDSSAFGSASGNHVFTDDCDSISTVSCSAATHQETDPVPSNNEVISTVTSNDSFEPSSYNDMCAS